MQRVPTTDDLLRHNRELPEDLRQDAILLRFKRNAPRELLGEFYRIHLTREHLGRGEEEFYRADVFQPHRVGIQQCPACRRALSQISLSCSRCDNPDCVNRGRMIQDGPVRGVVQVRIYEDFIVERRQTVAWGETFEAELVDRCLLILDRRYHPDVLAAVYRTAGQIADLYGWGLL